MGVTHATSGTDDLGIDDGTVIVQRGKVIAILTDSIAYSLLTDVIACEIGK